MASEIMRSHLLILCLLLVNLSCEPSPNDSTEDCDCDSQTEVTTETNVKFPSNPTNVNKSELLESFSDRSKIGRPRRNKIEVTSEATTGGTPVEIKFYSLSPKKQWILKQTLTLETTRLMELEPQIEDFNNDGFKDFTFISGTAARGANEVRTLLIYDRRLDEMVHITNSEHYPNMVYNKALDCIDSWMFHGATTTVFLKLEGDQLREFASVDTGDERIVTLIDRNGKQREIRRNKMKLGDVYTRYKTFDPPRAYR